MCELSVAAALGHLPFHVLPSLFQLLTTYQLPTEVPSSLPLPAAASALSKDKKNYSSTSGSDARVSVVLMSDIGCPVARKSLPVPVWLVTCTMARAISVTPPCRPIVGEIKVPGSKSVSNRALLLAALCPHPVTLSGLLHCDDTRVMIEGELFLSPKQLHVITYPVPQYRSSTQTLTYRSALNSLLPCPPAVTRNIDGSVVIDSGGRSVTEVLQHKLLCKIIVAGAFATSIAASTFRIAALHQDFCWRCLRCHRAAP